MPWYKVAFADKYESALTAAGMIQEFSLIAATAGFTAAVGLFRHKDNRHTSTATYFFSPAASEIAIDLIVRYSGVECAPPSIEEVEVSVAHSFAGIPFAESR